MTDKLSDFMQIARLHIASRLGLFPSCGATLVSSYVHAAWLNCVIHSLGIYLIYRACKYSVVQLFAKTLATALVEKKKLRDHEK